MYNAKSRYLVVVFLCCKLCIFFFFSLLIVMLQFMHYTLLAVKFFWVCSYCGSPILLLSNLFGHHWALGEWFSFSPRFVCNSNIVWLWLWNSASVWKYLFGWIDYHVFLVGGLRFQIQLVFSFSYGISSKILKH